jgi:hypothetical protein
MKGFFTISTPICLEIKFFGSMKVHSIQDEHLAVVSLLRCHWYKSKDTFWVLSYEKIALMITSSTEVTPS